MSYAMLSFTEQLSLCREWLFVVMYRNWWIIRARNIAILYFREYPTFRMLHSLTVLQMHH